MEKAKEFQKIFQFKITLKDTKPPVWRRIQVPETYTFWDLHVAIQDAMGWWDSHLHSFHIRHPISGMQVDIGIPFEDDDMFGMEKKVDWEMKIADWFTLKSPRANYMYDFGDSWEHSVVLEKILQRETGISYPVCIDGKRACPPEDCGGIGGYLELLYVLSHPKNRRHKELKGWLGNPFDSEYFDPLKVGFDNPKERLKTLREDSPN